MSDSSDKLKRKTLFALRVHSAVVDRYRTLPKSQRQAILHQLKVSLYKLVVPGSGKASKAKG